MRLSYASCLRIIIREHIDQTIAALDELLHHHAIATSAATQELAPRT